MRPFGCPVTILNTLDPLGKFDGKADEGFLVGYSINSKAFRVFNTRTRKVEENLHITFLENKPNVAGSGPDWLFDIDLLTNSMNYEPSTELIRDAVADDAGKKTTKELANEGERNSQEKEGGASNKEGYYDLLNTGIFSGAYDDEDVGAEADINNLETTMNDEEIRSILAYASFMGFIVYQMDVKSAFLYGTIKEEVYVCQPPGFEDLQFPNKAYKVEKALYGLHQAPRAWYETLSTYLLENRFRRGTIDKTLFIKKDKGDILELPAKVKQKDDGIFINQDKYVADLLKKFDFVTLKTTITPIETNKALLKDEEDEDVDVHLYRINDWIIDRSFRYLKGQPKLGLWYLRDSPFDLKVFYDSDYAGASLDRKSIIGGCQFLGKRLISLACKKQTFSCNSTTEAEYVAAAN
ncbi:putative ribonuclease H-like domain-containing protein [Tanacetum coccineum]